VASSFPDRARQSRPALRDSSNCKAAGRSSSTNSAGSVGWPVASRDSSSRRASFLRCRRTSTRASSSRIIV